jgi:hypothetical protein
MNAGAVMQGIRVERMTYRLQGGACLFAHTIHFDLKQLPCSTPARRDVTWRQQSRGTRHEQTGEKAVQLPQPADRAGAAMSVNEWMEILRRYKFHPSADAAAGRILEGLSGYPTPRPDFDYARDQDREQLGNALVAWARIAKERREEGKGGL